MGHSQFIITLKLYNTFFDLVIATHAGVLLPTYII